MPILAPCEEDEEDVKNADESEDQRMVQENAVNLVDEESRHDGNTKYISPKPFSI